MDSLADFRVHRIPHLVWHGRISALRQMIGCAAVMAVVPLALGSVIAALAKEISRILNGLSNVSGSSLDDNE